MNIFISADIEGIGGVVGKAHWDSAGAHYKQACEWMAGEVNAAIEGALDAGARRVVVKDAHEDGMNLRLDALHSAAELISGWGPLNSMVEGLDSSFQAVLLIGYHARGPTLGATLAHTWSSNLVDLRVNGNCIGETGWAAAFAGHFNVPVALVTGDDKLAAQVREELPAGCHTVITKYGMAFNAARMRPVEDVRKEIRETARRALGDVSSLPVFRPTLPLTVTMRFRHWEGLSACAAVPGVERVGVDTFSFGARDVLEAQRYFATLHRLATK